MGKASRKKKQKDDDVSVASEGGLLQTESAIPQPITKLILHIIFIVLIGIAAYSNTFKVPFIFDDLNNIKDNSIIKNLDNFISASKGYGYNPRRFIGYLTFALNYHIGGLDVTGYHIVNLVIHITNAILVYFLVIFTFWTPYFRRQKLEYRIQDSEVLRLTPYTLSPLIALFSALFFVAHPIQTQAVTYIVQRFTSLTTMFYLLSVVLYIKGRLSSSQAGKLAGYALSLVSAILAMMTKEISFTLPIVIVLYEFVFFKSTLTKKLLFLIPVLLTIAIIPLSIMGTDKPLGEIISDLSEQARETTSISRWDYLITQMRVIATYIRLIFLPVNQNLDYAYPIYHSLFTPLVLSSFLFLLSIFALGLYLLYSSRFRVDVSESSAMGIKPSYAYYRLIAFGILWFFITLSVESSIIPIRDVIFEHRVYLPSVGAFITVTASMFMLSNKFRNSWSIRIAISLLVFLFIVLSSATYRRNNLWRDEMTLWEDVIIKSPNKARAHNNLAYLYDDKELTEEAIEHYNIAIQLNPNYADAHYNIGIAYNKRGLFNKAIEQYLTVLRLKPDFTAAYNNLGVAYYNKGLFDKAMEQYQTALRLKPDYADAHYNLGDVYDSMGLTDKAVEHYQAAIKFNHDFAAAYNNLGVAYYNKGLFDKAMEQYQTALRLKPDYADAHYNIGCIYFVKSDFDNARKEIQRALLIKPDYIQAQQLFNRIPK
ncbi:MAG: tetratricopeptide repeat protein [Nitrospirae bacterium]|nr:tetratricopeptide repeat protein [Nitrospirota bacterium]